MIELIIIAVLLLIILYGLRELLNSTSQAVNAGFRKGMIWFGLVLFIILGARFGWVVPALGALAVVTARLVPLLRALAPHLQRILQGSGKGMKAGGPMSREEAYQILGLAPGASREQILAAHRRLMQKLHPDRGGTNYLAGKINQARDILLSR